MPKKTKKLSKAEQTPETALEDAFRKAAEERHAHDGDLEFDDDAKVSLSEDNPDGYQGAYVQCWKYIPMSDLSDAQRKRFKELLASDDPS